MPTVTDLRTRKLDLLRGTIQESILAGGLDDYRSVVEALGAEHDLFDIAAAAVKLAQDGGSGGGSAAVEEIATIAVPSAPALSRVRMGTAGDISNGV